MVCSLLTLDDSWHNFHHAFPWDYRMVKFNLSANTLYLLAYLDLAYNLKIPSPSIVRRHMKRLGDETSREILVVEVIEFKRQRKDIGVVIVASNEGLTVITRMNEDMALLVRRAKRKHTLRLYNASTMIRRAGRPRVRFARPELCRTCRNLVNTILQTRGGPRPILERFLNDRR